MNNKELISNYEKCTAYTKTYDAEKLQIWAAIENHFKDEKIQRVLEWKDKRDLYADDYRQMIDDVWNKFSHFDSFSSSGGEEFRAWIEKIILYEAEKNKAQLINIKKDKIKNMKEEIKKLESDLKDDNSPTQGE
jgi:hypothetical protein